MENTPSGKQWTAYLKWIRKQISPVAGAVVQPRESEMGRYQLPCMNWWPLNYCIWTSRLIAAPSPSCSWYTPDLSLSLSLMSQSNTAMSGKTSQGNTSSLATLSASPLDIPGSSCCFKLFLSTEPYTSFTFLLHVDSFNTLKEKREKFLFILKFIFQSSYYGE